MFCLNETINKAEKAQRSTLAVSLSIYPSLRRSVGLRVKRVGIKSLPLCVLFSVTQRFEESGKNGQLRRLQCKMSQNGRLKRSNLNRKKHTKKQRG